MLISSEKMHSLKSVSERALSLIRDSPRITVQCLEAIPEMKIKKAQRPNYGRGDRLKRSNFPPLGHVKGRTPLNIRTPKYPYYKYQDDRNEYYPISLFCLQNLVDMNVIDPSKPIDFGKIMSLNIFKNVNPVDGFQLTLDGVENFRSKVFIEVQHVESGASEQIIAAIERVGGCLITSYYDSNALRCLRPPSDFFSSGSPIPPRLAPPKSLINYYTNPEVRGYLCNEKELLDARVRLGKKFGFDGTSRPSFGNVAKNPRQIFFGLNPGMVVNMPNKTVLKFDLNEEYHTIFEKEMMR